MLTGSVLIDGAGINKKIFVDRLTTIITTFVVHQSGRMTIRSDDPAATVATLQVS